MNYSYKDIAHSLLRNISGADLKGFDPYDIKAHPFFLALIKSGQKNKIFEIIREVILEITYQHPVKVRKLFNIEAAHNAKASALIGTASLELSCINEFPNDFIHPTLRRVDELLMQQRYEENGGYGWGYPFDWQSRELIPAFTPNGIVTTAVGEYYWTRYQISKLDKDLTICSKICSFLNSLPTDRISPKKICFSYVPHFQNHVHNLNLFIADFLIKTGLDLNNNEWVERGHQALNYTLSDQHINGAFDYNGPPETPQNVIDNYHTGFVLRMLGSCKHHTGRSDLDEVLKKGLEYYINTFFLEDGTPRLRHNRTYQIDIHSAAEAINCLTFLHNEHPEAISIAKKVLNWVITNMYDKEERDFYYALGKSRFTGRVYRSEIKYMRWAQAWMLRALSRFLYFNETGTVIR